MKKVLFALAIAGMFGFVACNNNKTNEEVAEDTMVAVEAAVEDVVDTNAVESMVEEVVTDAVEAVVAE
jgi:hypothetical protein